MKEGRKTEYPEKTPDDELQKMPHTMPHSSLKPDSNLSNSTGGRRGKQMCKPLHHVSPPPTSQLSLAAIHQWPEFRHLSNPVNLKKM